MAIKCRSSADFGGETRLDDALVEVRGGRLVELDAAVGHDEARAIGGRQVHRRAAQRAELDARGLRKSSAIACGLLAVH